MPTSATERIAVVAIFLGTAISVLSAFSPDGSKLQELKWLLGTWKRESAKSVTYESWRLLSDRTFEGESHRIAKATGDTVFTEHLMLVEMGGEVFYIPKIAENKYPVPFRMSASAEGRFVFENPEHDFPQRITYQRNADGSLLAVVDGKLNGEDKQTEFHFHRVE